MSVVMLRRATRDLRPTVLWYGLGLFLYAVSIILLFPAIREDTEMINQYLESFPAAVRAAFGISDMGTLAGFVGAEYLNVVWPLIVGVFVIMTGAGLIAMEIDRGTVEFWLSVPETRTRLLLGKLGAFLAGIVALVAITLLGLVIGGALVGETIGPAPLLATGVVLLSFPVAVGGYSVLLSSLSADRGRPAGLAAGITLLCYILWVVSSLSARWDWLRYLSIFTPFKPQDALASGTIPVGVLVLFAIGVVSALGALVIFQRRDVIA
ncbi:ABC transporter permease subunit [Sphaerobacter sp.]|uniref:ABC transporter permease subunit n=1 Tax=Sphaerobacter sp. TaxID=2099654 RepID=UPI001E03531F|nr:ABC transporter permease subunit [Sphaerobacter sp.]MBX5445792.1 ABC transporter permease subunit [Sphaerobacter sp.]